MKKVLKSHQSNSILPLNEILPFQVY